MNIICTILAGLHCLMERVSEWAVRRKISKKSRREKAVFVVGAAAVAAVAFSCNSVHAQGKNKSETPEQKEEQKEDSGTEEGFWGLDELIQGVLVGQVSQAQVTKVGTSFEVVLVGQRMGKNTLDSHLDFAQEGPENLELLKSQSIGMSEGHLTMSDGDYETLLKIVEAEAGGEDEIGKILVANVIFNRMENEEFPDTVTDVVWQNVAGSPQFSPTVDGRIHTVTVSEETREAVNKAIDGEDYSQGALYFVEESIADQDNVAWFKSDLKYLFKHGVHTFYTYP